MYQLERPLSIEYTDNLSIDRISIELSDFWATDFDVGWAVDPTRKTLQALSAKGYISSDDFFQFYTKDTFTSDGIELNENQFEEFIDPLVENAINMIKKYAIPFFNSLDEKRTF